MEKLELQFDLLKTELELTQGQMDKYDNLSSTIKNWAVILWVASSGWSFQAGDKRIIFLSVIMVGVFWVLDAINKNFRQDYKKKKR